MAGPKHARHGNPDVEIMPFPARVRTARLRNGLRMVMVECSHLHGAAAALYARAGSRYETARSNGLSHFVEHMLFRGSAGLPSSFALNRAIEERCGMLNGETGRDYSLFQVHFHPRELGEVLRILGDLFAAPRFSDIDLERKIVLEEILDDFDEHGQRVNLDDVGRAHAWRRHPLGFPITGPERNIRRFSRREVLAHFRRYYGARNLVLAVAGPVAGARVLACARQAFGGLPAGRRRRARPAPGSLGGPRFHCLRTDSAQIEVQILFRGLPDAHPLYPALVLLLRLLDDGMATPLHYRVCDRRGLAYHVNAALEPLGDTSLVEITAACAAANLPDLLGEIFAILGEMRERPALPWEKAKAKRRYARDLEAGFDDVEGLCAWYGDSLLAELPLRSPAERYRRVARVGAAEIRRVARKVLRPEGLVVTAVGSFTPSVVRRARALVRGFTSSSPTASRARSGRR
ncbi:MAG: insulinase family protein [Deltaproteobacteria bacterium]|nr:insulinase family protein [Deltaproteobacteria bacterium]